MYWFIAFSLWAAAFFLVLFNVYQSIALEVSHARGGPAGWLSHDTLNICKISALTLFISSVAVLYLTETIDFHWSIVVFFAALLIFASSFIATMIAKKSFIKKHPELIEQYIAKKYYKR